MRIGRLGGVWVWPSPDVNDTPCRLTDKYWTFVDDRGQCPPSKSFLISTEYFMEELGTLT